MSKATNREQQTLSKIEAIVRRVVRNAERIECDHGCEPGRCVNETLRTLMAPLRSLAVAKH